MVKSNIWLLCLIEELLQKGKSIQRTQVMARSLFLFRARQSAILQGLTSKTLWQERVGAERKGVRERSGGEEENTIFYIMFSLTASGFSFVKHEQKPFQRNSACWHLRELHGDDEVALRKKVPRFSPLVGGRGVIGSSIHTVGPILEFITIRSDIHLSLSFLTLPSYLPTRYLFIY